MRQRLGEWEGGPPPPKEGERIQYYCYGAKVMRIIRKRKRKKERKKKERKKETHLGLLASPISRLLPCKTVVVSDLKVGGNNKR